MDQEQAPPDRPRLADVLAEQGLSRSEARRAMRAGKVSVHGVPTTDGGREVDPARVKIDMSAPKLTVGRDVAFLHRDEHLVVVWKPAGMLSVTAPARRRELTVMGAVSRKLGNVFPVHRLDEHTSGLMLVARTEVAQQGLKELLEQRAVKRNYLAIVDRHVSPRPWTMDSIFVRNRGDGRRGSLPEGAPEPEGAQRAITHFRRHQILRQNATLIEARLESGRTHQVRIHADDAGHPVLGDNLYGGQRIQRRAPRLALHAAWLAFEHPMTGQRLSFHAPLADDLEILRRTLMREREPREDREDRRGGPGEGRRRGGARGRGARGGGGAGARRSRGKKGPGGRSR